MPIKKLKFKPTFIEKILKGEKTNTWRLFDDKNLSVGDELELTNAASEQTFARAKIVHVDVKPLRDMDERDYAVKFAPFQDVEERLKKWRAFYGERVTLDTPVKIITFNLEK